MDTIRQIQQADIQPIADAFALIGWSTVGGLPGGRDRAEADGRHTDRGGHRGDRAQRRHGAHPVRRPW